MSILGMDPPRQNRLRALVSRGFTPRRVHDLLPRIQDLTDRYLAECLENGQGFDWIADFAGKLPMDVISEMMGVPEEDRAEVRRQADIVVHREDGIHDVPPAGAEASMWLVVYYQDMVDQRRKQPTDDLTSALIEAELDGERLSDEDVIAFLFLMVVAGNETTTKLLGHALFHLTRHPDQLDQVLGAGGRRARAPWIEETLRFDTSSQLLARYLLRDVELHGAVAPQGSKLLLCLGSANRDERVFSRPTDYDITRDKDELAQILSFGGGRHFCLGANLARLEARVALTALVERVRSVEVDHDACAGCTRSTSAASRRCRPGWRRDERKYAQPDRRPAVVTGASSGIGAATALSLAAAGFPVALGARRVDKLEEVVARIRADGGEAVAHPLDLTDEDSVAAFAKAVTADLGDIEVVVSNAGAVAPGTIVEVDSERFTRELDLTVVGAHRLVRAFVPGMIERRRGDIVFISSDTAVRARPFMAAYSSSKWGLEGMVPSLQMELEGTGVRASIVRPGPTWSEMGSDWDADEAGVRAHPVGQVRMARHPHFMKARRGRRRDHHRRQRAARRPPEPRRGQPRSPVGGTMTTTAAGLDAIPEVSYAVPDETATATSPRCGSTRSALFHRVRDECGDIGRFRLADKDVVMVTGAEANEAVLPGAGLDARPGGGVPVHDADLRQGRRLRRLARGAPADAEEPGAARRHDARPRPDHRGRDQADGRRVGRRGRDRPARLVRRAHDLHDVRVPDRHAVPRGARRTVRRSLPRARAWHRRAGVRRPVRRTSSRSHAATPRARRWSSWSRGSSTTAGSAAR